MSNFLATKADLEPGIRRIESQVKLKYVANGWHRSIDPEIFYSALDIPEFGKAVFLTYEFGERRVSPISYFTGTQKYLVFPVEMEIIVRTIPQVAGGILYLVDFESNKNAFWFQPGGRFEDKELIGGCIVPATLVPEVRKLCFKFDRIVTGGFVKVPDPDPYSYDPWKIGPEALELIRQGVAPVTDSDPLHLPEELKYGKVE